MVGLILLLPNFWCELLEGEGQGGLGNRIIESICFHTEPMMLHSSWVLQRLVMYPICCGAPIYISYTWLLFTQNILMCSIFEISIFAPGWLKDPTDEEVIIPP